MREIFGAITPIMLVGLITALVEWVKRSYENLPGRTIQFIALAFTVVIFFPYILLTAPDGLSWFTVYEGAIYSLVSWLSVIGFYEVFVKRH